MRVTRNMMVENMKYWLSCQFEALNQAEEVNSSGKKVNRPSDDPLATGRILSERTSISQNGQYRSNISQAQNWITAGNDVLETIHGLVNQAKEIAMDQSTADSSTRSSLTTELSGLYDQIVDLANTQYGGSYLFSGDQSNTRPFANQTTVGGGSAQDIVFDLGGVAANVEIKITDRSGTTVRTLTGSTGSAGTNTVAWDGLNDSGAAVADGDYSYTVTATDSSGGPVASYHAYRGGSGSKTVITGENNKISIANDGGDIFGQAIKAVSQALAALQKNPYQASDLEAQVSQLSAALDSLTQTTTERSLAYQRLGTAGDRIDEFVLTCKNQLNDLESADTNAAAVTLQNLETAYSIALSTSSSILKMSNLASEI